MLSSGFGSFARSYFTFCLVSTRSYRKKAIRSVLLKTKRVRNFTKTLANDLMLNENSKSCKTKTRKN